LVRNDEEFPQHWEESLIVSIYKKDDEAECSKSGRISLFPNIYKILSNILLSPMLGGSLVTMAWHILMLQMEGNPLVTEGSCKYIE
jgi:hypothetical protein